MANFMYLFRSNPGAYRSLSPEQMQQLMKKWTDWRDTLEKSGNIKQLGDRLDGTGKVVRGKAKAVTDGPYVEVKDFIQGYMIGLRAGCSDPFVLAAFKQLILHESACGLIGLREFFLHRRQDIVIERTLHDQERYLSDRLVSLENFLRIAFVDCVPWHEESRVVLDHCIALQLFGVLKTRERIANG